MHESEIKNIIHTEVQDNETRRQKMGCHSPLGCTKGKEHDAFINGTYKSDKNDIREFVEKQTDMNDKLTIKHSESMKMLGDILTRMAAAVKDSEEAKQIAKGASGNVLKIALIMISIFGAAAFTSMWKFSEAVKVEVSKVNTGDRENQRRTEAILLVLAANMSNKTNAQISKEIKEKQEYLEKTK